MWKYDKMSQVFYFQRQALKQDKIMWEIISGSQGVVWPSCLAKGNLFITLELAVVYEVSMGERTLACCVLVNEKNKHSVSP